MPLIVRIALVLAGMLALAFACVFLFALGLTTADALGSSPQSPGWTRLHYGIPVFLSFATYILSIPALLLTLIPRSVRIFGRTVIGLSLLALASGLFFWLWNQHLGWIWPLGLLLATAVPVFAAVAAMHAKDGSSWTAWLSLTSITGLAGSAAMLLRILRFY